MMLAQNPTQLILLQGASLYTHIALTAVICIGLLILFFAINKRFVKLFCACGIEVAVWLMVRAIWGKDSLGSQILCYVTAVAVIALTLAIVNRINWNSKRQ
jgi:hypothetical protein